MIESRLFLNFPQLYRINFADYGFNRSHSVAYAYLAYQTAYLKAHYTAYFYAAVLSNEADDTSKIYKYSTELRSFGLSFLPPDINESDADFTPLEKAVRFGLSAIKGIGMTSVQAIIEARKNGRFTSLFDFTARLGQGAVNRRGLESLITAGAFDSFKPSDLTVNHWRARLFAGINNVLSSGQKVQNDKIRGQNDLFGELSTVPDNVDLDLPDVPAWSPAEMSRQEKAAVGFYLSSHPIDDFKQILTDLKIINVADYAEIKPGDKITLAGIVTNLQIRYSKKGNRFCIFRLEDQSIGVKCLVWSETFGKFSECLKEEELLIVSGKVETTEGQEITLILEEAKKLADAIPAKARSVSISLRQTQFDERYLEELAAILNKQSGSCDVFLNFELETGLKIKLQSQALRIKGTSRMENELREKGCQTDWIL